MIATGASLVGLTTVCLTLKPYESKNDHVYLALKEYPRPENMPREGNTLIDLHDNSGLDYEEDHFTEKERAQFKKAYDNRATEEHMLRVREFNSMYQRN